MTEHKTGRVTGRGHSDSTALTVTRAGERVHLVHTGSRPPGWLTELAARLSPARPSEAVIVVGTSLPKGGVEELCCRLAPVLDASRDAHVGLLMLIMSEGANDSTDHPSAAQLMCVRWGIDVLATAGSALVTSDGSLFSPNPPGASGGWWHFSPGVAPRRVNSYVPVPDWRAAVQRVGGQTVAGHVVEAVPAGLAVRPAGPAPIATHTWPHALPPERARPQLILASPNVPVAALAVVIAALPERIRRLLRLVSMNGRALLQTGQALADLLGSDVRVAVGAPRLLDEGGLGGASAGDATAELGMVDADGRFWRPFAQTIVCSPTVEGGDPRVRVTEWQVPPALRSETEPEALKLGEYSKAVVTPAGLWIGPGDSEPPLVAITRPSSSEDLAIDLGTPHQPLDDCLWPGLDGLFELLESEMRERIVIHVHGALDPQDHEHLLELCVRHGLRPADRRASTRPTLAAHHSVSERHDVDENHRAGAE